MGQVQTQPYQTAGDARAGTRHARAVTGNDARSNSDAHSSSGTATSIDQGCTRYHCYVWIWHMSKVRSFSLSSSPFEEIYTLRQFLPPTPTSSPLAANSVSTIPHCTPLVITTTTFITASVWPNSQKLSSRPLSRPLSPSYRPLPPLSRFLQSCRYPQPRSCLRG